MKKLRICKAATITTARLLLIVWLMITILSGCSKKLYPDTVYTIFPEVNGQVQYSDSIVSDATRGQLFTRAKTWLLQLDTLWGTHRIKLADEASGTLQAQNRMDIYFELPLITQLGTLPEKGYFNYSIRITVQDHYWKYSIDEIRSFYCQRDQSLERASVARGRYFEFPVSNRVSRFNREWMSDRYLEQLYTGIDNRFRRLILSLTNAMNKSSN